MKSKIRDCTYFGFQLKKNVPKIADMILLFSCFERTMMHKINSDIRDFGNNSFDHSN
jgi:hypothetical protein